jgi:hypothetical protein
MNQCLIKLLNGETIICSIVSETDTYVTISDPLKMEMVNHGGMPTMMTTYWIPLSDEELVVDIKHDHVIMISDITDDMSTFYEKALKSAKGGAEPKKEITNKQNNSRSILLSGLTGNTVFH